MSPPGKSASEWRKGFAYALGGALVLAAANTFGDFLWTHWVPSHRWYYGLAHGMLLFLFLGLYLGFLGGGGRSLRMGVMAAPAAGVAAAASFYVFAPLLGYSAMFLSWLLLWVALGWLLPAVLHDAESRLSSGLRGIGAGLFSGAAFYAVSGIWFNPAPGGPDYAYHFFCWTLAFFPALAFLLVGRPAPGSMDVRPAVYP